MQNEEKNKNRVKRLKTLLVIYSENQAITKSINKQIEFLTSKKEV